MITIPQSILGAFANGNMTVGVYLKNILQFTTSQLKDLIFDSFADVLPIALSVAGAILVVTLGWRLFRNFTRG